ncbi:hypothetical protein GLOIN_2v1471670 [Rhizophagus clarus]|uniref:Uncharacterized protein n=1 Tax=Rhizophagus clarus TaxID=94130 RepID=A0A8H3QMP9_9GLOM|nr:hypothetical protein GLOIN_2v1471670 [Rhizophagus clarus]
MFYFFIIFVSFFCPFVSAQVSNDYTSTGFIDVLISFMVPFVIFLLADYEYSDGSACLSRSFVYLINIGIQQEISFIITSIKLSNSIKILQHIVTGLMGLHVILNIIYYIISNRNIRKDCVERDRKKIDFPEHSRKTETSIRKNMQYSVIFYLNYLSLILFAILLGLLLKELKEDITQTFIITLIITISLTFIFYSAILLLSLYRNNLKIYINDSDKIIPKYHVYIDLVTEFICINILYLPSLINCFLLQTPEIFNKIFLNLSALLVTTWIVLAYKVILKREGKEENDNAKEVENK